ncbi:unnamed protein product, partial [Meganyctiphanes norvegica]
MNRGKCCVNIHMAYLCHYIMVSSSVLDHRVGHHQILFQDEIKVKPYEIQPTQLFFNPIYKTRKKHSRTKPLYIEVVDSLAWDSASKVKVSVIFYCTELGLRGDCIEYALKMQHLKSFASYDFSLTQYAKKFDNFVIFSLVQKLQEEKTWKVSERIDATIPLGRDLLENSFHIKIQSLDLRQHNNLGITIFNSTKKLYHAEYILKIERTRVIIRSLSNKSEVLMNLTIEKAPEFIRVSSINGEYLLALSVQVPSQPNEEPVPVPISDPAEKMQLNNGPRLKELIPGLGLIMTFIFLCIARVHPKEPERIGCRPEVQKKKTKKRHDKKRYEIKPDMTFLVGEYDYLQKDLILDKKLCMGKKDTPVKAKKPTKTRVTVLIGRMNMTNLPEAVYDLAKCYPDDDDTMMFPESCFCRIEISSELPKNRKNDQSDPICMSTV